MVQIWIRSIKKRRFSIGFCNQTVVKKAEVSEADWKLAKLHLQVLMSFYSPGMQHNWVHFVFPSTMTPFLDELIFCTAYFSTFGQLYWNFKDIFLNVVLSGKVICPGHYPADKISPGKKRGQWQ